jgi:hypothetical protein
MFEEVVPAIAAALSAQGSELVAAGSRSAVKALYDVVRARFGRDNPEADALDAAVREPGDAGRVAALAERLSAVMVRDPDFADRVAEAWHRSDASGSAGDNAVVNNFAGQAHQVVQTRTIRGGIKF